MKLKQFFLDLLSEKGAKYVCEAIREALRDGRINQSHLNRYEDVDGFETNLTHPLSRANCNEKNFQGGALDQRDYNVENNRINNAVEFLLGQYIRSDVESMFEKQLSNQKKEEMAIQNPLPILHDALVEVTAMKVDLKRIFNNDPQKMINILARLYSVSPLDYFEALRTDISAKFNSKSSAVQESAREIVKGSYEDLIDVINELITECTPEVDRQNSQAFARQFYDLMGKEGDHNTLNTLVQALVDKAVEKHGSVRSITDACTALKSKIQEKVGKTSVIIFRMRWSQQGGVKTLIDEFIAKQGLNLNTIEIPNRQQATTSSKDDQLI